MRLIDADAIQYQLMYKEKFMQGTGTEELAAWKEDIDALPPVNLKQRWIPCSERLPEKEGRYLVTCEKWGAWSVDWNIWTDRKLWLWEQGVSAWMSLPEPWRGEE